MTRQAVQTGDHAHGRTYTRREVLYSTVRSGIGVAVASVGGVWTHAPSVAGAASSVTVGYSKAGFTCEGATFAAQAQGYFRDEGLDLTTLDLSGPGELASEMMKGNVGAMQDPAWTLVPGLFPPGMHVGDMVATAGLQRGSMNLVVPATSAIRSVADLRGLKVSAGARWRWMFGQPLRVVGLNPRQDVDWQPPLPPAQVAAALTNQQVAAIAVHQPYAAALESSGVGRILIAQNTPPLQDDYCCAVIVSEALVQSDRPKAAAITQALMRGSAWVRAHPSESAQLMVEVKHVTASLADTQRSMATLDFFPAVEVARRNTLDIVQRFKRLGFLDQTTDEPSLLERIFVPITGEL
jgi:NitT/TauT family transport system substrate-binding protein